MTMSDSTDIRHAPANGRRLMCYKNLVAQHVTVSFGHPQPKLEDFSKALLWGNIWTNNTIFIRLYIQKYSLQYQFYHASSLIPHPPTHLLIKITPGTSRNPCWRRFSSHFPRYRTVLARLQDAVKAKRKVRRTLYVDCAGRTVDKGREFTENATALRRQLVPPYKLLWLGKSKK